MADLARLLTKSTRAQGIHAAVVVARDGLLLHSECTSIADNLDLEAIGALACSIIPPAEDVLSELGPGQLLDVILEYDGGMILIEPLGDLAVLSVAAGTEANLGLLRLSIRRLGAEVKEILTAQ